MSTKTVYPLITSVLLILIAGCSTAEPMLTPELEDENIEPTNTLPAKEALSPSPVGEMPEVEIDIPAAILAEQTAEELLSAKHLPRDRYREAKEILGLSETQLTLEIPDIGSLEVNDRNTFTISRNEKWFEENFRLRHISDSAYWWANLDTRAEDKEIIAAAIRFEDQVLPLNQLIFGKEWSPGIDGDRRIHILLRDDENWGAYGYFSLINEYPKSIQPSSNQKELFVLKVNNVILDSPTFAGRLAHEYLHMILWNPEYNEDHWLNEGLAELAYYLAGAPPSTDHFRNKDKYFAQLSHIQLTSWPELRFGDDDHTGLAQYSAGKHFLVYLLEQYGPRLIKDIFTNPQPGVASIREELDHLPGKPQFDEVYANWLIAKLIDRPEMSQGQFGYQEYPLNYFPYMEEVQSSEGGPLQEKLPPYGARYYLIKSQEPVQVSFSGTGLAQLTPDNPPTGNFAWYSNRGDESEFSLTRSFDLTGINSATLNYKIWYELDEYYDYAYLEVSSDGGQTWEILKTAHCTEINIHEQALGCGYTGATTDWLSESIDLDPYTGQEIMLRFQLLTDYNTNRDGVQIDDIAIPEIGFFDGAEDDSGGWVTQGFVRSSNLVPADWIVWLVKASNPLQVERIELTPEKTADLEIADLGEKFTTAALVISPIAPTTTMELDYELVFQHP